MRSIVTSKNVSWPRLIWPTLYVITTTVNFYCAYSRGDHLKSCRWVKIVTYELSQFAS